MCEFDHMMNSHWRIRIVANPNTGEHTRDIFYLDATDFDLDSLLDEPARLKSAVLRLMDVPVQAGSDVNEALREAASEHGDALLQRLFRDDCINASVTFSNRPGAPEFEQVQEPVKESRKQLLMVKHGVEFGRVIDR